LSTFINFISDADHCEKDSARLLGKARKLSKRFRRVVFGCLKADWGSPQELKQTFPKASIVANNRVVFNIVGGNYRLVVKFAYKTRIGYIRFIGTHKEYDLVKVSEI